MSRILARSRNQAPPSNESSGAALELSELASDALDRALALTFERATAANQWDVVRRVMAEPLTTSGRSAAR